MSFKDDKLVSVLTWDESYWSICIHQERKVKHTSIENQYQPGS